MNKIKKIAVVLLAGVLAGSVAVMAGCQNNDSSSSSKSESSAASKAEESKKEESKEESKKEESKEESKKEESKEESKKEESSKAESSAESSAEASAEAADASILVGTWIATNFMDIATKKVMTPEEYATEKGLESAPALGISFDADGNAVYTSDGSSIVGTYTFDGTNAIVTINGEPQKFEYNAESNALGSEDSGTGIIFTKMLYTDGGESAATEDSAPAASASAADDGESAAADDGEGAEE